MYTTHSCNQGQHWVGVFGCLVASSLYVIAVLHVAADLGYVGLTVPFGSLTKVQATRSNVQGFTPFRIPRMSNVWFTN